MEISSVEELVRRGALREGDELIFKVKKDVYRYCVKRNYCNNINHPHNNDVIFNELGINKKRIAEVFYGYPRFYGYSREGDEYIRDHSWPEFKVGDFESLKRLEMGLFTMTDQWAAKKEPNERIFIKGLSASVPVATIIEALINYCPGVFEPKRK